MRTFLCFALLTGCASTPEVPPLVAATGAGVSAVSKSVRAAEDETLEVGVFDVEVRYNPARCDCPDFEFKLRDAWVRAWAVGPEPALRRLQSLARQSRDSPGIQFVTVRGRLSDNVRRTDDNVLFPIFETVE